MFNNGVCSDPTEQLIAHALDGFAGSTCEVNIDECQESKCTMEDAIDGISNYTCECENGWTGGFCDFIDKDECEDRPCKMVGACRQTTEPGDYNCECVWMNMERKDCEEPKVKTCVQQPCLVGTCIDEERAGSSDQYRCDCAQGYEGLIVKKSD